MNTTKIYNWLFSKIASRNLNEYDDCSWSDYREGLFTYYHSDEIGYESCIYFPWCRIGYHDEEGFYFVVATSNYIARFNEIRKLQKI